MEQVSLKTRWSKLDSDRTTVIDRANNVLSLLSHHY